MVPVLVFLGALVAAWYVLIIRPQQEHQDQHESVLGSLSQGQYVMTVGGIFGRVEAVSETSVLLEVGPGITARVAKDGISRVVNAADQQIFDRQQAQNLERLGVPAHVAQGAMQQAQGSQFAQPVVHAPAQPVMQFAPPAPSQPVVVHAPQTFPTFAGQQLALPDSAERFTFRAQVAEPVMTFAPVQVVQHQTAPAPDAGTDQRGRRSRAPKGMGGSITIEGEVATLFERARTERTHLADEYKQLNAPLVAVDSMHADAGSIPRPHAAGVELPAATRGLYSQAAPTAYPSRPVLQTAAHAPAITTIENPFLRPSPFSPRHTADEDRSTSSWLPAPAIAIT